MTIPANLTTVTLTGVYGSVGAPLSGSVSFTPSVPTLIDNGIPGFLLGSVTAHLDDFGRIVVSLPATDNTSLTPSGWTWQVTESILGLPVRASYNILLPASAGPIAHLELLAPVGTGPVLSPYYGALNGANTWSGPNVFNGLTSLTSASVPDPVSALNPVNLEYFNAHVAPTSPWVFSVLDPRYGAKGDGRFVNDASITSGSNLLNSPTAAFTSADLNKWFLVPYAGAPGVTTLVAQVTAVNSATQVALSVNASQTVSASGLAMWATDDTAAIQACINAADAYATTHGSSIVYFPPGAGLFYGVAGPLVTGGSTKGNAQLTIPLHSDTTSIKPVLWFTGTTTGAAVRHWNMLMPEFVGSTIVSFGVFASSTAQTNSLNAAGQAAVISGPTGASGYGTSAGLYDNVMPVFSNMSILTTHSQNGWGYGALNLHGCANASLFDFGYGTTGTVKLTSSPNDFSNPVTFANGLVVGLVMPGSGNNDRCHMNNVICQGGYTRNMYLTEHTDGHDLMSLYGWSGIGFVGAYGDGGATPGAFHGVNVTASIEGCTRIVEIVGPGAGGLGPQITAILDVEEPSIVIADQNFPSTGAGLAAAVGSIRLKGGGGTVSTTNATNLVILDDTHFPGPLASPPALTINTAIQNPVARPARVTLGGGAVTSVSLGNTVGGASAPAMTGQMFQPQGALIGFGITVPALGWIQVSGATTPTSANWYLE